MEKPTQTPNNENELNQLELGRDISTEDLDTPIDSTVSNNILIDKKEAPEQLLIEIPNFKLTLLTTTSNIQDLANIAIQMKQILDKKPTPEKNGRSYLE